MKKFALALLALTVSAPALAAGQLPRTVVPVSYDITVTPDAKAMTFTGRETVTVDVREATRTITLNAADLAITTVTFDGRPAPFQLVPADQRLVITLPTAATTGQHKLAFAWTGKINQSAAGLFAIDYTNGDGSTARMLATQFEAPDARRFAPMWDEPAFKAKFTLSAVAPAGQLAYSNMPVTQVTKQGDGSQLYRFGQSPLMSSYLLFLGMGDVERKTVQAGPTEIGVITRRGVVDQGDYALAEAKRLLAYYNDYFGQPYPLPKLDMIAGPGSSQFFGAMENWGAIFYFENELLFDPKRTTESGRQRIFTVVSHEIAHQWFGNLVTMSWWDDLWLNEGFASWMEGKSSADLNPAWESDAAAVVGSREAAMGIDATAATHPVIRRINSVDEIGEAFDGITYSKGEAVIGMLESTLGEEKFRDGLRRYMARYKYGNTVTAQLWAELAAASGTPVTDIADSFTTQGGVPLVTMTGARCAGGATTATLTQGRYGLDAPSKAAQTWRVPLVVSTLDGGETRTVVSGAAPAEVRVPGCGTVILNRGKGSYTRVMYDDAGHAAIVRDYAKLPLADRLGTLGDDFTLSVAGYQDLTRWTALTDRIGDDAGPLEISALTGQMRTLSGLYQGTPLEEPLRARAIARLSPALKRVGMTARPDESVLVANLRETLVGRLGAYGDPMVAAEARRYAALLRTDPTAVPPAIRQPILSTYAINATPAEWDALLALAKAETSPVAKNRFVQLLGASRDEAVAARALALLETDQITAPQKAGLLRAVANAHPDLAFDWAVAHRPLVEGFLEASTRAGFIVELAAGSNDPAMPAKVQAYATASGATPDSVKRTLSAIAIRREVATRLQPAVATWVGR